MIRIAVDDAIDDIIESGINERETDIEAIKEKIFLEVASRLEEAKLSSQVRLNDSTEKKIEMHHLENSKYLCSHKLGFPNIGFNMHCFSATGSIYFLSLNLKYYLIS